MLGVLLWLRIILFENDRWDRPACSCTRRRATCAPPACAREHVSCRVLSVRTPALASVLHHHPPPARSRALALSPSRARAPPVRPRSLPCPGAGRRESHNWLPPSSPAPAQTCATTLSICAALALLTALVNPGSLHRCRKRILRARSYTSCTRLGTSAPSASSARRPGSTAMTARVGQAAPPLRWRRSGPSSARDCHDTIQHMRYVSQDKLSHAKGICQRKGYILAQKEFCAGGRVRVCVCVTEQPPKIKQGVCLGVPKVRNARIELLAGPWGRTTLSAESSDHPPTRVARP